MILLTDNQKKVDIDHSWLCMQVQRILTAIGVEHTELSILIVGVKRIQGLNKHYRNVDIAAEVLSFPQGYQGKIERVEEKNPPQVLGDIVLAPQIILRYCQEQNIPLNDRLEHLIIHSVLHLLGYTHENSEDSIVMENEERRLIEWIRSETKEVS